MLAREKEREIWSAYERGETAMVPKQTTQQFTIILERSIEREE
jgi:hypothetical protein